MASLDGCNESYNAIDDWSSLISVPNKIEDANVFNMTTKINESKTLIKHSSYNCKCEFHGRKCNSNRKWNKKFECKNPIKHPCEKNYNWNVSTCAYID